MGIAESQSSLDCLFWSLLKNDGLERFAGAFLRQSVLLQIEVLATGVDCFVSLRMRSIAARALSLGADRILVAHNHPSGDPRPSAADVASTRRLFTTLAALDVELLDHLIFARSTIFSMRKGVRYQQ